MPQPTIPSPFGYCCWLLIASLFWLNCTYPLVTSAQEVCLSLSASKACPAFSQYSVNLTDVARRYPTLMTNVTDVESFDEHLLTASITKDLLVTQLGCNSNSTTTSRQKQYAAYPRYTLTSQCAILVQGGGCNRNASAPPLCKITCDTWVESLTGENTVADLCNNNNNNNNNSGSSIISQLVDQCANNASYNGTTEDGCIAGPINEPDSCGFQWDVDSACQYCSSNHNNNKNDPCCASVLSTCNHLNDGHLLFSGAIAGIILGSLAFGALLCGLLFYFGLLRKKKDQAFNSSTKRTSEEKGGHISRKRDETISASQQTLIAIGSTESGGKKEKEEQYPPSVPLQKQQSCRTIATYMAAENMYTAVHVYPPQQDDELMLYPGDTIMIAIQFDDGWGFGYNLTTGEKGALPMVCVEAFPSAIDNSDDRSSLTFQEPMMIPPGVASTVTSAAATNNSNIMNDSSVVLVDSPVDKDHRK